MKFRVYSIAIPVPLFLAFFMASVLTANGQYTKEVRLSLHLANTRIKDVFLELEKRGGITISYPNNLFDENKKVTISADNQPVKKIIEEALAPVHVICNVTTNGNIIIRGESLVTAASAKQPGDTIRGVVIDNKTNQPLAAVSITNKKTRKGVFTNSNGAFSIVAGASPVVLVVSHIGYKTKEVTVINEQYVKIQLAQTAGNLDEVVISARRKANNETALLNDRKNAAVVSDGISAKQIEKTASLTTTQALQRVSGVTITDDKYVAIRGLGDRSVIAELNGARLSSSDPDRTAVPLDLVPAALLENITIYKTLTPDKPADASAGIVELKTRSVPDSLTIAFVAQAGTNSTIGLGGQFNAFRNYNLGFWGQQVKTRNLPSDFLNLSQQYPGGRQQIQQLFYDSRNDPGLTAEANRINNIMLRFDPVITTTYHHAAPNQVYAVIFGNTFNVFKGHKLGVVISGNYYKRTEDRYAADLNQWSIYQGVATGTSIYSPLHIPPFITPDAVNLGKYLTYKEYTGVEKLNYGALAGLTYQISRGNEISVQYLTSSGAQAEGSHLSGAYQNTGLTAQVKNELYGLKQQFRTFNTLDVQGEHAFWNKPNATRLSWNISTSTSKQNEPDYRFVDVVLKRDLRYLDSSGSGIGTDTYGLVVGKVHGVGPANVIVADPNGRRYRHLNETNRNLKADLSQPFQLFGQKQEVKVGVNLLKRERDFSENVLGLPNKTDVLKTTNGDINSLVSYSNVGLLDPAGYNNEGQPRVGGFLYQMKKSPNNYTGTYETHAFYAMADVRFNEQWRLAGGVRLESTDIHSLVDTANVYIDPSLLTPGTKYSPGDPHISYKAALTPYYSANLIYTWKKNMNFRFAYARSLARPELRELTNIYQFDPFQFAVVSGNPSLVNQTTNSVDFRWEWFTAPGEVLSVSAFGKIIDKQLTKVFVLNSLGNQTTEPEYPIVQFVNDPEQGKVYGIELELRKNLGLLWKPLNHFFIGTNSLIAASEIKKNPARLQASRTIDRHSSATSPIFEQAPYVVNAYLDYDNPKTRTNITASFNIVGERLVQVQLDGTPDLYDRPVPVFDLVFSQYLLKRFQVKGFMKNLLNPPYRVVYATPHSNGLYHGNQYIQHQYYKGTEYSLGITYNLF